jgi:hypothetical protein
MESDADEPRDEGTGLSAFDDLDQVSTVSTLEKIPEAASAPSVEPARLPLPPPARGHSVPPPGRASVPPPGSAPPLPRGATPRSVPPPPATTGRASVPPPVPPGATPLPRVAAPAAPATVEDKTDVIVTQAAEPETVANVQKPVGEHDDTRVLPTDQPFTDPHEAATRSYALEGTDASAYDAAAEPEDGQGDEIDTAAEEAELRTERFTEPEPSTAVMPAQRIHDDDLLELSATTAAREPAGTPESEPVTDIGFVATPAAVVPMPAPAPVSQPPKARQPDFEDDAVTNVLRSERPIALPTPARRGSPPTAEIAWPQAPDRWASVGWGLLIVIVAVGVGLGIRVLVAKPDPGMATLVTVPIDARVSLDGRPLVGQTSPFSMQGLAPDVDHRVEVTREGYLPQETVFRVNEGEVKLLSPVELKPTKVETGFAIDSMPRASTVFVDGERQAQLTPMRRADLTPGRHSIRLEHEGHKAWEMHLILADGQMVDLPQVTLMQLDGAAAPTAEAAAAQPAPAPGPVTAVAPSPKRKRSGGSSRTAYTTPRPAPMIASAPAPEPAGGGGLGALRVNSRPWSQVYVDGRLIGNTPQMNIPLPAGKHQLDLVNPQLGMKKSLAVKIKAGETMTKVINLVE